MTPTVQLRAAKIPGIIGYIAVHHWFVILTPHQQERWEIWQNPCRCSDSWGHLHHNLMGWNRGVGNGDSWQETAWQGEKAQQLAEVIVTSPHHYPYQDYYRYYPGPNSNTYVQWVLQQANLDFSINPKGIGKNYLKPGIFSKLFMN